MVLVAAPQFDLTECNSEKEREFIEAIHARAEFGGWYADCWSRDDRFVMTMCSFDSDPAYCCILRTLRVDFDGSTVWCGPDETHQCVTDLTLGCPAVSVLSNHPIAELATMAADWLEREMQRPIVRHEWDRLDRRGVTPRLWVLADTGEALVARGLRSTESGPPDRVVPVG